MKPNLKCGEVENPSDGGVILAGGSWSEPSGNKTSPHYGSHDLCLIKLRPHAGPIPLRLVQSQRDGPHFRFWFQTESNASYTVEYNDDLRATNWLFQHTLTGDGSLMPCLIPMTKRHATVLPRAPAVKLFRMKLPLDKQICLGIKLNDANRPLITRGWFPFTSGAYAQWGYWAPEAALTNAQDRKCTLQEL